MYTKFSVVEKTNISTLKKKKYKYIEKIAKSHK